MTCIITCLSILYDKYVNKTRAIDSNPTSVPTEKILSIPSPAGDEKKQTNELNPTKNKSATGVGMIEINEKPKEAPVLIIPKLEIEVDKPNSADHQSQCATENTAESASQSSFYSIISSSNVVDKSVENWAAFLSPPKPLMGERNSAAIPAVLNLDNDAVTLTAAVILFNNRNKYTESMLNLIQEDDTLLPEGAKLVIDASPHQQPAQSSSESKQQLIAQQSEARIGMKTSPSVAETIQPRMFYSTSLLIRNAMFVLSHLTNHSIKA